ncbi:MAG: TRAP transporter substrate-binding protein DctP [Lachnospiraceae bacterium]|nr:TRAP transporter substrate-binding protein DctP [Lachnospiraceae bacterium]
MKKLSALFLTGLMVFSLAACGQKTGGQEPAAQDSAGQKGASEESAASESDSQESNAEDVKETYNFKVSITQAPTDPLATYTQQWMDEVTEKTGGAVTFEFHPNGELGTINDVCEQVSRGASIIAYAGPDAFSASAPDLAILNSQYCLTSADQIDAINQSDWFKGQAEKLAQDGNTRILSWNFFTGYRHILSKTPIETPDDLNGVQIRVADSPAAIAFVKALGCSPVVTNWNEVYSSISTNIVTACEAPLATLYSSSLQEVAQYCTLTNHLVSTGMMVMPEDIFASMPEEYQNILLDAVYQAGADFTQDSLSSELDYRQKMEEAGVSFIEPDVDAFASKASAMYSSGELSFSEGLYEEIQTIITK